VPEYQTLTDDEVLQLAAERDELTADAQLVLDSELARRRLSIEDVHSHKIAYDHSKKLEQARTQRMILRRGARDQSGIGFRFLGKRNVRRDPSDQFEECDSPRWFTVLWIPVFPIGTFTVRRTIRRWMGIRFKSDPQIITRHPRNWEQILLTWGETAAVLLALGLAYLLLVHSSRMAQEES